MRPESPCSGGVSPGAHSRGPELIPLSGWAGCRVRPGARRTRRGGGSSLRWEAGGLSSRIPPQWSDLGPATPSRARPEVRHPCEWEGSCPSLLSPPNSPCPPHLTSSGRSLPAKPHPAGAQVPDYLFILLLSILQRLSWNEWPLTCSQFLVLPSRLVSLTLVVVVIVMSCLSLQAFLPGFP